MYHNAASEEDRAMTRANVGKNLVNFWHVVFELCERTDRQTDRHTRHNTWPAET